MAPDTSVPRAITTPLRVAVGLLLACVTVLAFMAATVPVTTTIKLAGQIASERPGYTVQHPYGGPVREVAVRRHDRVTKGQLLLRLDVDVEVADHRDLSAERDRLTAEITVLRKLLADGADAVPVLEPGDPGHAQLLRYRQTVAAADAARASAGILTAQADALRRKIALLEAQQAQMTARGARTNLLAARGLATRTQDEVLAEQVLIVRGERETESASLLALQDRIAQSRRRAELSMLGLRAELAADADAAVDRLVEVDRQLRALSDRIARAEVRAPADGVVTAVAVEQGTSFAPRGSTLITIAPPTSDVRIAFAVPPAEIDQVRTGMTGRLILPALPQRNLPRVDATVQALSPRAETDEHGSPTGYAGEAVIDADDLARLLAAARIPALPADMPVQLVLEARHITFAQYFFAPFTAAFGTALQD